MYFRILKKELKRKKAMNLILLAFITLATMFVSSSVNNIVTVMGGLDYYFEQAGMPDYYIATMDKGKGEAVSNALADMDAVDSYGIEPVLYLNPDNLSHAGKAIPDLQNSIVLMAIEDAAIHYFDEENEILRQVEPGTVWLSIKALERSGLHAGDSITVSVGGVSEELKIAGGMKDAYLGSDMVGMDRFIMNGADFAKFNTDTQINTQYGGSFCYIRIADTTAVEKSMDTLGTSVVFTGDKQMMKLTYMLDMVIAGLLLVVSVCLILISFLVLRFTIAFTISEEYREIGVMKAIGIRTMKIRGLYLTKYLALAVAGAVIGFAAGIPFGKLLLGSVSKSMVLGNDCGVLLNLLCAVGVVGIILLFCFSCTRKVARFTPLDAIRSGMTGERFKKKSFLRLQKTRLRPAGFLAANDVLSSPRRYLTVMLTNALCLVLLMILANTANTLKSSELISFIGMTKSDAYYTNEDLQMSFMTEGGRAMLENELAEMEQTLANHDMPAKCSYEVLYELSLTFGDNTCNSRGFEGVGTTTDQYVYQQGTPPQNAGEIAITPVIAEKLGADIGDTIFIRMPEGEQPFLITAIYQSMNNMGEGVRLHESLDLDFAQSSGAFAFQITFTDHPSSKEVAGRIARIQTLYNTDKVYSADEYVDKIIGVADTLNAVKRFVLLLAVLVIALVTVLMERSFLAKERGEIAILKAMGFQTGTIVRWHGYRFGIVGIAAAVLAAALSYPLTLLAVNPIFSMMGALYGVPYRIVPAEIFLLYPAIGVAVTLASALLTALYAKTIAASEASGIE